MMMRLWVSILLVTTVWFLAGCTEQQPESPSTGTVAKQSPTPEPTRIPSYKGETIEVQDPGNPDEMAQVSVSLPSLSRLQVTVDTTEVTGTVNQVASSSVVVEAPSISSQPISLQRSPDNAFFFADLPKEATLPLQTTVTAMIRGTGKVEQSVVIQKTVEP